MKDFSYEQRGLSEIREVTPDASYIRLDGEMLRISASDEGFSLCTIYDMNGIG